MKRIRGTLSLIIACSIIIITALNVQATQADAVIFVDTVQIEEEQSYAVLNIGFNKNSGIAAGDIKIVSDLKILKIEGLQTEVFSNIKTGKVNWSEIENKQYTGSFLKVTFEIPQTSTINEWGVSVEVEDLIDENLEQVSYEIIDGGIVKKGSFDSDSANIDLFVLKIREYIKMLVEFIRKVTIYI